MATRAQIAVFDKGNGRIKSVYSHYDGGDYMKNELNTYFNNGDAAEKLVDNPDKLKECQSEIKRHKMFSSFFIKINFTIKRLFIFFKNIYFTIIQLINFYFISRKTIIII